MALDPRATVLALVELAVHKTTPKHEAMNAAMAACRMVKEHGFLILDFMEEGAGSSKEELVTVEIPFIILTQSDVLLRVSRIEPPKRHSSHVLLIPKEFVRKTVMMTLDESKAIGWGGSSNIIKSLTLVKTYFERARQNGWDHWR